MSTTERVRRDPTPPHRAPRSRAVALLFVLLAPASAQAATEPNTLVNPLVEPTVCVTCHVYPNAAPHAADPIYSPFGTWQGSMMANSARDPVFWAGIAIASQDDQSGAIGNETELCIRCHAPRAFLEGRGGAISQAELQPADLHGVECELCHRMIVDNAGMSGEPGNAQYTIDDVIQGGIVARRGPWTYDMTDPYPPPHAWINDPAIGTSALCGTCHDVTTPRARLDDQGTPTGTLFNEQRTYSEWLGSAFSDPNFGAQFKSCPDCHEPAVADMAACVQNVNNTSHPSGGRRHTLAGANLFMLEVLDTLYGDAGSGEVQSYYYGETAKAIDEVLATAATLALAPPDSVALGDGLQDFAVTVTNDTGHKLPTGYSEGRVMWLEVIGRYGDEVVFASGLPEHVSGEAADPLLRTYRGIAEQYSTGTVNHLLLNDHWVEDTRIPPLGLLPDPDTDPVGDRYELGMDGKWPNYDVVEYDFAGSPDVVDATPGDATDDDLEVTVRLLYVINTAEYIEFLADTNATNEAGQQVADVFALLGGSPAMVLEEQTVSIPIVGFGGAGSSSSGDGGVDGTGTSASGSGEGSATLPTSGADSGGSGSGNDDGQAEGGGGGCGCRSSGDSTWSLLSLPLFALLRRRRR